MNWIQLILETQKSESEFLDKLLMSEGALAVTYADAGDQPLFEPKPGETPLWEAIRIIGLFEAGVDMQLVVQKLRAAFADQFSDTPFPAHRAEILEDKDWMREWMDQFKPMRFGERLWVCPSWHSAPEKDAVNILLDPGLAFGTGTHATTVLCLEWLESADLNDQTIVDYGCGSGILGIAALKLGCKKVFAIDIDSQALQATNSNAHQNGILENQLKTYFPNQCPACSADAVISNILAGPLASLAPELSALVKPGGKIVLSGILADQINQVIDAYSTWFDFKPPQHRNDWILLEASKHQ